MISKRLFPVLFAAFLVLVFAGQSFGAVLRVNPGSGYDGPGDDWCHGYRTIAEALTVAAAGDEIWVKSGVYNERLSIKTSVSLYGGFSGSEESLDLRDFRTNVTIIDGYQGQPIATTTAATTVRIDGFTIRNGKGALSGAISLASAASGQATVVNNNIIGCAGLLFSGAIYGANLNVTISNNSITGCSGSGGAIYLSGGTVTISNNIIAGCSTPSNGGAIYLNNGASTIFNNVITANYAKGNGGGICFNGTPTCTLTNNTIVGNSAANGGGIYITSPITLKNNVIAFNSSGLYNSANVTPSLTKNCVYNPDGSDYFSGTSQTLPGTGNILADPRLLNPALGDTHLIATSPCIDAGEDTAVQSTWTDIDGQARTQGSHVDIGADEYCGTTPTFTPQVIRVSPAGSDSADGSSWATAKKTIQAAITAAAVNGGEVWIAAGTYQERITLANRVFIFGGFAGTEPAKSDRDPVANVTILDGLTGGSVVTAQNLPQRTCGIDGFTIRNGKASNGGGIYCSKAGPVISSNVISGDTCTTDGSAIYCTAGRPVITGNTISNNVGPATCGAVSLVSNSFAGIVGNKISNNPHAAVLSSQSDLTIENNTISANGGSVAAVYCGQGNMAVVFSDNKVTGNSTAGLCISSFTTVTISGNTVESNSGNGVLITSIQAADISNNLIRANKGIGISSDAQTGGISGNTIISNAGHGIYKTGGSLSIASNLVTGNQGAGIYCSNSQATVSKNTIVGNTYSGVYCLKLNPNVFYNKIISNGGGVYSDSSNATIANNIISGNTPSASQGAYHGCGICCYQGAPAVCNNTITGNVSEIMDSSAKGTIGGAMQCIGSSATISNNLMAFNASGIYCSSGSPVLTNNCVYNPAGANYYGLSAGGTDIQVDPKLVSVEHGEVHLKVGSPCIDAGSDAAVQTGWTDIDNGARKVGQVDIGADEFDKKTWSYTPSVIRVKPDGDDTNDGSTWALAKRTIQAAAADAAPNGSDIWVAAGTYTEQLLAPAYVSFYGGFAGTESTRDQRDFTKYKSIIDGGAAGVVVTFMSAGTGEVVGIDGFTVRNGKGAGVGGITGGWACPIIRNNTVTGNVGAGIACGGASIVTGNTITGNPATKPADVYQATANGGGICLWQGAEVVSGNTVSGNTGDLGAGIYCAGAATISNNIIKSNASLYYGGGLYLYEGSPATYPVAVVTGNEIIDNTAGSYGGGIRCRTPAMVTNNTLVGNSSPTAGAISVSAGIYSNNTVAFNSSGIGMSSYLVSQPVLRNNCVYNPGGYNYPGLPAGVGDISLDPLFVNRTHGDYHLAAASPCINAGWAGASNIPATDIDGETRPNGVIDIGADEYWAGVARSLVDAKAGADGSGAEIYGGIVTATFPGSFYIESDDRASGILVKKPGHGLSVGNRAHIAGSIASDGEPERRIDATLVEATGTGTIQALAMANKSVGGGTFGLQSGVWGWVSTIGSDGKRTRTWDQVAGLNNIGLLISVYGKVTGIEPVTEPAKPTSFTIDDGSGIDLKCIVPNGVAIDPAWQHVKVTGVSSCERVGTEVRAVVKVRMQGDLVAF